MVFVVAAFVTAAPANWIAYHGALNARDFGILGAILAVAVLIASAVAHKKWVPVLSAIPGVLAGIAIGIFA
jgi:hypothetical protein